MIETIQPCWQAPAGIHACSTTRKGGFSIAPFESLNLAQHVGDDRERVAKNRRLLRRELGLPNEPGWINQTHGTHVVTLEQDDARDADAAITRKPGHIAVVMTADCLPILVCNRNGGEVAAIHAGWRGLQAGVIQSALARMRSSSRDLMAWIGPGISQACFEVGAEVRTAFVDTMPAAESFFAENCNARWLCDLAGLAEQVLNNNGVAEVYRDPHCSHRDADLFFSYRRESTTGRMASLIWME